MFSKPQNLAPREVQFSGFLFTPNLAEVYADFNIKASRTDILPKRPFAGGCPV